MLRPNDYGYLSVNWLEFLQLANRKEQIREIRRVLGVKLNKVGAKARIAALEVEVVINQVRNESPDGRELSVLHEPEEVDPSHSGIYGMDLQDDLIADLIAEVVSETYPAKDPDI